MKNLRGFWDGISSTFGLILAIMFMPLIISSFLNKK